VHARRIRREKPVNWTRRSGILVRFPPEFKQQRNIMAVYLFKLVLKRGKQFFKRRADEEIIFTEALENRGRAVLPGVLSMVST